MYEFDYLVVGAGLFGAIFAYEAKKRNKRVLVIDKRDHIAGNIFFVLMCIIYSTSVTFKINKKSSLSAESLYSDFPPI